MGIIVIIAEVSFANKKSLPPILKKIKKFDEQNQKLADLRDWLLPMLMSGQVSVEDIKLEDDIKNG